MRGLVDGDENLAQRVCFDGGKTEVLKGFSEPATIYELLGTA